MKICMERDLARFAIYKLELDKTQNVNIYTNLTLCNQPLSYSGRKGGFGVT